jgi:NAD(P)-dependent dehydrogenase (short-subunit alcohol dehydrogenase family)
MSYRCISVGKATAMRFAAQGAKICLFDVSETGVHAAANGNKLR